MAALWMKLSTDIVDDHIVAGKDGFGDVPAIVMEIDQDVIDSAADLTCVAMY